MNESTDSMKEKILSLLSGEQYEAGQTWDALEVWGDVSDFYRSLGDSRLRAEFERVAIEFLYEDDEWLLNSAFRMCYGHQIRAAIPRLIEIIQEHPEHPLINIAYMALGEMEAKEAADLLEAAGYVDGLFRVDFYRAIPVIQRQIEETCEEGYDRQSHRVGKSLAGLRRLFTYLCRRFGTKGIFLLLEELNITNEHQATFVLDAIVRASDVVAQKKMYPSGHRLTDKQKEAIEAERRMMVEEIRQWLQSQL